MRTSTNNNQRKCNSANFSSDEKNEAGANKWIPVKGIHSNTVRRKHTQQSNNLITLSNSFEALGNLHDSFEKSPPTFQRCITLCVCRGKDQTLQRNTV
jgi:hypothetical protein